MKRKQKSGGAKMLAAGKHAVMLRLWPEELEAIAKAANLEGRPVTNFITHRAVTQALKTLDANDQGEYERKRKARHTKRR